VSFDDKTTAYTYDAKTLKVLNPIPATQELQTYRQHINATEALLEWQTRKEFLAQKKERH
jgi:hypothetical protein